MIQEAMKIAIAAHEHQVDKAGKAYIFHPLTVASRTANDDELVCALLHDVVEDSDYSFDDLQAAGIPNYIIDALKLLTHNKDVPYMDYVRKIKENPLARAVKLLDLEHNSDLTRLPNVTEKDLERIEKYKQAICLLRGE